MINVEALTLALKFTEEAAERGKWRQTEWLTQTACGTAGCLAGNYALATGCVPVWNDYNYEYNYAVAVTDPNGNQTTVYEYTREQLGLTHDEAEILFASNNTLQDLRNIVADLISDAEATHGV